MKTLHTASVLVSALLLFLIEPMVAKAVLPLYGGSPAVWNSCLVFFQGLLLLGYGYAHVGARWPRGQLLVHAVVLLAPLLLLPPHIPTTGPPARVWPVPSLLATLALAVGAPFFVLATHSSLVQKWHALRSRESPYFLYAVSNVGSFAALLAYPLIVEPSLGLHLQLRLWSLGYVGFVLMAGAALVGAWRQARTVPVLATTPAPLARRLRWLIRAAVPSSLLLAVSLTITTDVAAIPLLWVVPLGLYLFTFVLAFWPRQVFPREVLVAVGSIGIAAILGWPELGRAELPIKLGVPLLTLFVGCWICHADLAHDQPEPEQLTEYYLWIAAGGFAGGVFGNLVAPLLFNSVAEYPLSLALLAVLFSVGKDQGAELAAALRRPATWLRFAGTGAIFAAWVAVSLWAPPSRWDMVPRALLIVAILLWKLPGQFAAACFCAALINLGGVVSGARNLDARRSFFGVVRVREANGHRNLVHGTTWHGAQQIDPFDPHPALYYAPLSPLSRVVGMQGEGAQMAVIGLGAGSVAYYTKPGQLMRYYEIDPIIEPMARRWFTFLHDAPGKIEVELGDARLTLRDAPPHSQDLLLVDAFSSDAIPVHLLTVEAIQLYLEKLTPNGFIVLHLSNRYLDLVRVPRAIIKQLGIAGAYIEYTPDPAYPNAFIEAVALAPTRAPLERLFARGWTEIEAGPDVLWTDDQSNLLSLLVH